MSDLLLDSGAKDLHLNTAGMDVLTGEQRQILDELAPMIYESMGAEDPGPGQRDTEMLLEHLHEIFQPGAMMEGMGSYGDEYSPPVQAPRSGGGVADWLKKVIGDKMAGPAMQEDIDRLYPQK